MQDSKTKITKISKLFALLKDYKMPDRILNSCCDILAIKFAIENLSKIPTACEFLNKWLSKKNLPLIMICGSGKDEIDEELLPKLISLLDRQCIISFVTEKTYKKIIPYIVKGDHYVVLKTPIDLNLAKELNILSVDLGLSKDRIIMNTDIGGLGYGYEYGYSIMEKARLEGEKGDEYLNLPIISEAPLESLKTKEARISEFENTKERARMIELSSASGVLSAGANIIVLTMEENIKIMKGLI